MAVYQRNSEHSWEPAEVFSLCVFVLNRLFYDCPVENEVRSTVQTIQLFSLTNNNNINEKHLVRMYHVSDTRLSMMYGLPSVNSYNNPSSLDINILIF